MMDESTIRLECLKLARPDGVRDPDAKAIIERAKAFLKFVTVQPSDEQPQPKRRGRPPKVVTH